ncbi:M42 family metallopeptidase [Acidaminobacter sp. JC074]|uniref:M42 family metallopeptidase n=1 Tax=Acidaminobacter sp. JC074 TaxID=2530199 RepID=UPI001F0F2E4F|nr:M42 family metallopeptidase [Acidaminobacter sp. JC074]MCH4890887.1 M42 family metallopeptidase [Acidaminobacter sp. JC074]
MTYFKETFMKYLDIPSPSSFTKEAIMVAKKDFEDLGLQTSMTKKGALIATFEGDSDAAIAITAHMDTLGAMVKSITNDGKLTYHRIGGGSWSAVEGENCQVFTRSGKVYRGSIIPTIASTHIHGMTAHQQRDQRNMAVRLDEIATSRADVQALGIQVGDIIAMDTRTEFTETDFIKTRYIDNKAAVAMTFVLAKMFKETPPKQTVHFIISNYEECGHGLSVLPENTEELIAIDIAPVGFEQTSSEFAVSIAAKDNRTPYDYEFVTRLADICEAHQIPYNIDVFNHYSSDASQHIMAGGDVRFACLGPGVEGTHHYERTHMKAIDATIELLYRYCL